MSTGSRPRQSGCPGVLLGTGSVPGRVSKSRPPGHHRCTRPVLAAEVLPVPRGPEGGLPRGRAVCSQALGANGFNEVTVYRVTETFDQESVSSCFEHLPPPPTHLPDGEALTDPTTLSWAEDARRPESRAWSPQKDTCPWERPRCWGRVTTRGPGATSLRARPPAEVPCRAGGLGTSSGDGH